MARIKYKEALGLEVKRGRPSTGQTPSKEDLVRLYIGEGKSIREVAKQLGCSKDMVSRTLKKYAIKARVNARRESILLQYRLADLRAAIREKGIRGYARELGIDEGTVRHHLKVRHGK